MPRARITSKGQVTIPKVVRDELALEEGDALVFLVEGDRAVVSPVRRRSQRELHGRLPATRPFPGREALRRAAKRSRARRHDREGRHAEAD